VKLHLNVIKIKKKCLDMMNKFKRREIILFIEVLILLIIDDINTSPISGQFSNNNLITTSTKCENITFKDQCPELKYNQTSSTEHHGSISDISLLTTKEMVRRLFFFIVFLECEVNFFYY
jgi:hypothetical protein